MASKKTVHKYIDDVLGGKVSACKWVKKACQRHLDDHEHGRERGLRFDEPAAQHAIDFFGFLKHSKGEWAGRTFQLEPWQQFCVWIMYGWKNKDGFRRFRTSYITVPRKNGKTTEVAGLGLYMLVADNEPGAEVYSVATKKDQAKISFDAAKAMVLSSQHLKKHIKNFKNNLHIESVASKFEPLSSDYNSLDGLNTHAAICDEVHAWPSRDLWDVMDTSTGSRRQSMMIAITTAGFDRQSLCFQFQDYTEKVLENIIQDDTWFGVIYTIDDGDDWEAESSWIKANPNFGISVYPDDIKRLAEQAKEMPSKQNAFKRLRLNIWTESETLWLNLDHWRRCNFPLPDLRGRQCYAGLDLSSTTDISACVLVFPPANDDPRYTMLCRFYIPQDNMRNRVRLDRVPYDVWVERGLITATPGNVIDYDFIIDQLHKDKEQYDMRELAFDRWGSQKIVNDLCSKLDFCVDEKDAQKFGRPLLVQFGQGFASMSAPSKELEKLVLSQLVNHVGHPVLTWMASNVVIKQDPAGNIKPDKAKSREKIDGIVAMIMGLDRAVRNTTLKSVYEERGVIVL